MTLPETLQAVDELPWADVQKLQARINQRRQREKTQPSAPQDYQMDADLQRELDNILKNAPPVKLVAGTMDVDKLEQVVTEIRESLTQEELEDIVNAMNEEYVKPDDPEDE